MKTNPIKKSWKRAAEKNRGLFLCLLILGFANFLCANIASALPQDYSVISGSATFEKPDESSMVINVASKDTIVNYGSFDIASHERVTVNLPDNASQILNRVTSGAPTNIGGSLTCFNGLCILVNEAGIYVAPTANINANNLVLSTRDITNDNFLAGNYLFEKVSNETADRLLLNEGKINIQKGGFGVLIAGAVENRGLITARGATIALTGGNGVRLTFNTNGLISVDITEPVAKELVDFNGNRVWDQIKNTGTIDAQGGTIIFAASSINDIFRNAVNIEGVTIGTRLDNTDGHIRIVANGPVALKGNMHATTIEIGQIVNTVPSIENVVASIQPVMTIVDQAPVEIAIMPTEV